ncbi:MAG: flagellar biosynthetic protein FliO [Chloroflexi bacterium]|nr:flagellar biosynthetic protein FliO [Chloroflexota bacterium]
MSDIGRNRAVLTSVAAIVIVLGLVVVGQMPKSTPPSPPNQTASVSIDATESPGEQFAVRDYADFSSGAESDIVSSDWLGLLVGMVAKLALVIVLIYGAIMVLRRYVYRNHLVPSGHKPIAMLGSLNLAPSRTVYVIEVGRKILVVGGTQNQLSLLTEIADPEAADEVRALSTPGPALGQFSTLLNVANRRLGVRDVGETDSTVVDPVQVKIHEGREFIDKKLADIRQTLKPAKESPAETERP